jgi:hypothetical protein
VHPRRLIGVVVFAFVGAGVFYGAEAVRKAPTSTCLPSSPPRDPAAQVLAEGMEALKQRNFPAARLKLAQLKSEHPSSLGASYLERSLIESEATERLGRARAFLDEQRWVDAKLQLDKVPDWTLQYETRDGLKRRLAEAVAGIFVEAESLRPHRGDREQMVRLEQLAALLDELGYANGRALGAEARAAIEELDMPWAKAVERYDEGDVADAVARATRCAKTNDECARLLKVFAAVQAQLPRLPKLSTAKLLELYEASLEVSEGEATLKLEDELVSRYEAVARRCRTAKDWSCVDRQVALADDIEVDFEDETISENLEDRFDLEVQRATLEREKHPARAKATLARLANLRSVDFNRAAQLLERWKQPQP